MNLLVDALLAAVLYGALLVVTASIWRYMFGLPETQAALIGGLSALIIFLPMMASLWDIEIRAPR